MTKREHSTLNLRAEPWWMLKSQVGLQRNVDLCEFPQQNPEAAVTSLRRHGCVVDLNMLGT